MTEEVELHDANDDEIGKILEINPDFVVAEVGGGFLGFGERRLYYIPRSHVSQTDDDDWQLNVEEDQLDAMGWTSPPTESAWSQDWSVDERPALRGGTRIRRYEEELEADTVQREAGEVAVNKRVVEDTRTIDVPVRREEVHVERHSLTGEASESLGDEQAFSGESIRVPVMEEDVEVRKVARPVEEIEITKTETDDTRRVEDTVRREEIDVDDTTGRASVDTDDEVPR
ncbi:MAG: YsnF/AvaK domain-containing protein [Chloroflexota bacterium]|nr:YsnF/AvaK domain-containing protein [Chloroflexota bacterium]